MRPASLAEVAGLTFNGEPFDLGLKNFLDGFYEEPSEKALAAEPKLLANSQSHLGRVRDAYLGAVAESLARANGYAIPAWTFAESRKLSRPWFALEYEALRAVLLWESPGPFRSRNLFVSENALTRV